MGSISGPLANWSGAGGSITGLFLAWSCSLQPSFSASTWHPCHPRSCFGGPSLSPKLRLRFMLPGAHLRSGTPSCVFWVDFRAARVSVYPATVACLRIGTTPPELFTSGCCEPSVSSCFIHSKFQPNLKFGLACHISSPWFRLRGLSSSRQAQSSPRTCANLQLSFSVWEGVTLE